MPDTVQLVDPSGQPHDVPLSDVAGLLAGGKWHQQTSTDTSRLAGETAHEQDYGGVSGGIKAAGYGLLRGGSLGGSDVAFRALGASAEDLRGYQEQFPKLTLGTETLGALLPALVAPESFLARAPAGRVASIGRTIVESAEGAGTLGKIATAAAGGGVEGALFSGGQYLSQVALEEKPLAAEGFIGAMGKGALWAAPIGGALAIGEATLHRAKGLFPRSQVTKQAAREVDQAATAEISNTVRDGDAMLEVARQKIAQTNAQAGAAQSAENASRAMFGAADPATIQNQVEHSVDKVKLIGAADKYTQAKARFEDWVRAEADPDLEAALLRIRSPDVQVGAPRLRSAEFGEVVPSRVEDPALGGYDAISGIRRDPYGTPGPHAPPQVSITQDLPPLPLADKTTAFDAKDLGLTFDPKKRVYLDANLNVGKDDVVAQVEDATSVARRPVGLADGTPASTTPDDELLVMLRRLRGELSPTNTPESDLAALLQATKGKLDDGASISEIGAGSPARADYVTAKAAKTDRAAVEARSAAVAKRGDYAESAMARDEAALQTEAKAAYESRFTPLERDALDAIKQKIKDGKVKGEKGPFDPVGLEAAAERELARRGGADTAVSKAFEKRMQGLAASEDRREVAKTVVDRSLGKEMRGVAKEDAIGAALRKHNGKDVDIGPNLGRGARAIDDLEAAHAELVDAIGADAPKTAVDRAGAYRAAVEAQAEKSGASAAKAAQDIRTKVSPADQITMIEPMALPKGPFEQEEFSRLQEAIHGGKVKGEVGPFNASGEAIAAEREMARRAGMKTVVDKDIRSAMSGARDEAKQVAFEAKTEKGIEAALRKAAASDARHGGPGGQSVARAIAGAIDDIAAKIPTIAEASSHGEAAAAQGADHKKRDADKTIVDSDAVRALRKFDSKGVPVSAIRTLGSDAPEAAASSVAPPTAGRGLLSAAADIGTAMEVLHAMGVHVPDISAIPVIGPVLGLYLKARAVLGILGRKGGSIGRTTESVVASKSAGIRDRVDAAAQAILDVGAKTARRALPVAGPAGALAHQLFPGDGETKSKDIRKLYDARMDEISRALAPGAIEHAVGDRIRTSDPELQDAIAGQVRRGIEFLASKAPRESMLQSMIPGDGKWHPSKAALQEWSRYVAAVHDPAGVLEDLVHGHVTVEGAETLRAVYPELYAQAQRTLLEHAAEFQKTLPYKRRVSISIMYRIPVDATMSAAHMQFLQPPPEPQPAAPGPGAPQGAPMLTAPLQLGQQTLTSLERRAGE